MTKREWYVAQENYHKASEVYNARLILIRAERERGNWSMDVVAEYETMHAAQAAALQASEEFYQTLRNQTW
jgi:hypothetical protein